MSAGPGLDTGDRTVRTGKIRRDPAIETLRGLACVLLVLYHTVMDDAVMGLESDGWTFYRWLVSSIAFARMPLFTVLSGYVYGMRPLGYDGKYVTYMRKKAIRLLVPLVAVSLMLVALGQFGGIGPAAGLSWTTLIVPIGHLWFLVAVFWVFSFVALVDSRIAGRANTVTLAAFAVIAMALNWFVPPSVDVFGIAGTLYLAPFFILGLFAKRFGWRSAQWRSGALVGVLAGILVVISQLSLAGVLPPIDPRHSPIATVLGGAACLLLIKCIRPVRPLVWVGGFSFSIYLFHTIAMAGALALLQIASGADVNLYVLVGVLAGIFAPVAIEVIARRWRITRVLLLGLRR